jgi:large subunit ribosomal protein L23
VKVATIRTLRVHGKPKRVGRHAGHRPDWKKAIVTLKKGQTIELFEQV